MTPERESLGRSSAGKSSADLEWSTLAEHLAGLCASEIAAARMARIEPAGALDEARERMALTAEALDAAGDDAPVPTRPLPDLARPIGLVKKGGLASGEELRDVRLLLLAARALRQYANGQRDSRPRLAAAIACAPELDPLLELLDGSIEPDGSVSDSASPTLRDARRRVGDVRRELGSRLGQLMKRHSEVLRDQFWTERDGRFVLPVRSDAHLRVDGIVLGSSASGGTLYVEPKEVTALGNRLKLAEAEVEREVARVLADLSDRVREHAGDLEQALESCTRADMLAALSRWAKDTESVALVPEAEPFADLVGMRHPLLVVQGIDVIPNDIRIGAGRALILSGPNAGGKTVVLKCLGLAAWMARAGVPIPLDPRSRIGWFDPVLSDIGDEQSLLKSLSTFSAHVENMASILVQSGRHALVLLDEVAAGTDPEEGAALASALLEALVARGAAVAVTTHYERLKELGASSDAFENASVGFDLDTLSPTFRLAIGVPGASSALAVAARHGIPEDVVSRAQALLPGQAFDREELVRRLESERKALETARREAEDEARRQRQLTAELEAERKKAREQERARLADEARDLTAAVRQARAQLRDAKKRLERGGHSREDLREIERDVSEGARQIALGSALESATRREPQPAKSAAPSEAQLVVGARVFLPKLGTRAEVVEPPHKGQVKVMAGVLKLAVPLHDLRLAEEGGARPKPAPTPRRDKRDRLPMLDGFVPVRTSSNTLDLRGQRVEEALDAVDAFVDRMLRVAEPVAYVLHGHGTGALKLAVRAHLSASPQVGRSAPAEPDDGGDAFTVFWLSG